ncbi:MAG: hypothetical protein BMS9Abin05_0413 [Rhodothermia bacterium]|nr:MAG: hypothetical protein BMS9Abin05_0413 [Rhodothermia bacterium]
MQFRGSRRVLVGSNNPIQSFWVVFLFFSVLASGCDLFGSAVDDRAPRVSILQPGGDTTVGGEHVLILIESEALGEENWISFVNVTVNGDKIGEANDSGNYFRFRLNSVSLLDDTYRIEAVAFDRFQARGISAPILLTVENQSQGIGPEVRILAPVENEEIYGIVRVVVREQPAQPAVTRIDLLIDGAPVLSTSQSTGSDTYVFDWNTSSRLAGEHIVEAKAYSGPATFSISDPVTVVIAGADDPESVGVPGSVKWRTVGYSGEVRGSVAVGFSNDIYVASSSDTLYAFSSTGTLKWKFGTFGPIRSSPLVGNNEDVFVTSEDGRLYGLDSDGHPLWTAYNTGSALRSSPALGVEGALIFGDADGRVHAVNSFNGQPLAGSWPVNLTLDAIIAPPVIAKDRTIFVASGDGYIYALSPGGSILWRGAENIGSVVVGMALIEKTEELSLPGGGVEENTVSIIYAVSSNGSIYSISGSDGSVLWSEPLSGSRRSAPVVGSDGTIYVGTSTGLIALNEEVDPFTPRLRFVFPADDVGTPAIDSNEVVYFVSRNRVHAINPNNTPFWNYDLGAESDAPLTISRLGLLVVAGQNGVLTTLETGSVGLALNMWPMFQRNARHTGRLGIDARD